MIYIELTEIQANYEYELSLGASSYKEFLTNKNGFLLKRLLTGCALQALQQLSGKQDRLLKDNGLHLANFPF